jgi:16S rRNA (adenine1518-N6/adenine1519-N6)-dimethyltransferase
VTGAQGRSTITDLLAKHDVRARRSLGQHFLADPNVIAKIVRLAAVGPGDDVLEIGAGTGTLTAALAATGARVLAFEVDERLRPLLAEVVGGIDGVELRFEDAMDADLPELLAGRPWVMVANLPYHVGTPLVLDLLRHVPEVTRYVVMVQREVADRLRAEPGTKSYGVPSVVVGLHGRARFEFAVAPTVFHPRPSVDSAVVSIVRASSVPSAAPRAVELAGAAFGQRRKTIRRSLAAVLTDAPAIITAAGLDPAARAENLAPDDYLRLAEVEHAG